MAKKAKVRAAAAAAAAEEAAAQETQPGKASVAAAVAVVALALAERLFSRFFPTAGEYEDRRKPGGASPLAPAAEKKACPYEVLGVSKGAPFKDVKRAYVHTLHYAALPLLGPRATATPATTALPPTCYYYLLPYHYSPSTATTPPNELTSLSQVLQAVPHVPP